MTYSPQPFMNHASKMFNMMKLPFLSAAVPSRIECGACGQKELPTINGAFLDEKPHYLCQACRAIAYEYVTGNPLVNNWPGFMEFYNGLKKEGK